MEAVTILHTNDFHNHLTEDQACRLLNLRADLGEAGLLLDAGDAISAGNVTYHAGGEPILEMMSLAGYDAMTMGNREFHFTRAGLRAKLSKARFTVLCANFRARDSRGTIPVMPRLSKTVAGIRITVFGLTVPMITEKMLVRKVSAYVFDDPIQRAEHLVPGLRSDCDLLVCLSHIGYAQDLQLATRVPGIDLIIGGHTHKNLGTGERVGDTLIVQAGWFGHFFGTVEVEMHGSRPVMRARVDPL